MRNGKCHASNICLVTFIIEIGFADPFDSRIFSINAELNEKKMITQRLESDRKARDERGERESERYSLTARAECSYFVLITKTLLGKGGKRTRSKEEKLAQREDPPPCYQCVALTGELLHSY